MKQVGMFLLSIFWKGLYKIAISIPKYVSTNEIIGPEVFFVGEVLIVHFL